MPTALIVDGARAMEAKTRTVNRNQELRTEKLELSALPSFFVVRFESEADAVHSVRSLEMFVSSAGGRVRLEGADRVLVLRSGATLYLSPGAISLASYLPSDPSVRLPSYLHGPEITPTPGYVPTRLVSSERIDAADLPDDVTPMVGWMS